MSAAFVLNPKRKPGLLRRVLCGVGTRLGFVNVDYAYVHGPRENLRIGRRVSLGTNVTLNTNSGTITIGDDTVFSHACIVTTGTHRFIDGRRAKLTSSTVCETPEGGYDVAIGCGVFVAAGAMIIGPVSIGDDCIIGAGAVVMRDVPAGSVVVGNPARVMTSTKAAAA